MSALGAFTYAPSRTADDASRVNITLSGPSWLSLVAPESGRSSLATLYFGDADSEYSRLLVDRRGFNAADDDDLDEEDFEEDDLEEEDDFFEDDLEDDDFEDDDLEEDDFDDLEDEEFDEDDLEDER